MKGTEDTFYRITTGDPDRTRAFMLGQFKFEGPMKDAVKLTGIGEAARKFAGFPP